MLRKLLGSEHRPWQAKQARLSHCPQKVNYTDNSTKQREEINPMWPHWKEESIKRCNERRPTQSSAGLAMMFTLWVCLYLLIWLVILLVTGEGITCYQTCRKSQVKLLESVFFSHLGSRIQVKSSAWWGGTFTYWAILPAPRFTFHCRQVMYVNKQSHSLGGHCPFCSHSSYSCKVVWKGIRIVWNLSLGDKFLSWEAPAFSFFHLLAWDFWKRSLGPLPQ